MEQPPNSARRTWWAGSAQGKRVTEILNELRLQDQTTWPVHQRASAELDALRELRACVDERMLDLAALLYNDTHMTLREIAPRYGVGLSTLHDRLRRAGHTMRGKAS